MFGQLKYIFEGRNNFFLFLRQNQMPDFLSLETPYNTNLILRQSVKKKNHSVLTLMVLQKIVFFLWQSDIQQRKFQQMVTSFSLRDYVQHANKCRS